MTVDPFRYVHPRATHVIWQLARRLHSLTEFMSSWIGRGWSPDSTEHATGRALDIIISDRVGTLPTPQEKAVGELIVAWLIRHADEIHIRHIIWYGRIWKRRYRGTPTEWTRHRGDSISSRHEDHIHVLTDDANGTVPNTPLVPQDIIEKEIHTMDANELAAAILAQPITANGQTVSVAQTIADIAVYTKAQSVAVADEVTRDNRHLDQLVGRLDKMLRLMEEATQ